MPRSPRIARWLLCAALGFPSMVAAGDSAPQPSPFAQLVQLAEAGNFEECHQCFTRQPTVLASAEERAAAILFASRQAYATGERQWAETWLKSGPAEDCPAPLRAEWNKAREWSRLDPRDPTISTAALRERCSRDANSWGVLALMQRANYLAENSRLDEAVGLYHEIAEKFPADSQAPAAMVRSVEIHQQLKQFQEAEAWGERLLREHPQSTLAAGTLYRLAQIGKEQGNFELARRSWRRIVEDHTTSPYWADATFRLATESLAPREYNAELLGQILASPPVKHTEQEVTLRGRCLYAYAEHSAAKRDWAAAEQSLEKLLDSQPEKKLQLAARWLHAETAYQRGDFEKAERRFAEFEETLAGDQSKTWLGIVPLRRAQIATRGQDWRQVLECTERLGRLYPEFNKKQEADYLRGRALIGLARFAEARACLEGIITTTARQPTETTAMAAWLLGESYFLQDQHELALAAYDQALAFHHFPQWQAAALLQSAKCCERLRQPLEAQRRYERLVAEFSETKYVAEARKRLGTQAAEAATR